ncbi:MAG: carboxypeptidase-like regulatory domain-containing protein [Blastocatellia bacterium]|nr:carboxypeptidase-like regulatory domain-containing protein [Blastocatellia bacterium]
MFLVQHPFRFMFALLLVSVFTALAGSSAVTAQTLSPARHGRLTVEWRDATTDKPIPNAKVEIYPAEGGRGCSIETDKKGHGSHLMLPEGFYTLIFIKEGYAPVEMSEVLIVDHQPARIYLKSLDAELAPYKKKQVRYERPILDTEGGGMRMVLRQ